MLLYASGKTKHYVYHGSGTLWTHQTQKQYEKRYGTVDVITVRYNPFKNTIERVP